MLKLCCDWTNRQLNNQIINPSRAICFHSGMQNSFCDSALPNWEHNLALNSIVLVYHDKVQRFFTAGGSTTTWGYTSTALQCVGLAHPQWGPTVRPFPSESKENSPARTLHPCFKLNGVHWEHSSWTTGWSTPLMLNSVSTVWRHFKSDSKSFLISIRALKSHLPFQPVYTANIYYLFSLSSLFT